MLKPDIIQISGPAGLLETIYLPSTQESARGVAVINHPNPLQGGTNTNKVIQTAAQSPQPAPVSIATCPICARRQ